MQQPSDVSFTFILVHGAWHGAWCWHKVANLLTDAGHTAITLDLPGLGDDQTPLQACTFDSYVARVGEEIEHANTPVVLVGHSFGGTTISQVAEQYPDAIALLVYVAALLPLPEVSAQNQLSEAAAQKQGIFSCVEMDTQYMSLTDGALSFFYHDCPPEDVALARQHLRPQALAPMVAPLHLSERYASIPRGYVACANDRVLPYVFQTSMAASCPFAYTLPTGHSPFFAQPALLADALVKLAHTQLSTV